MPVNILRQLRELIVLFKDYFVKLNLFHNGVENEPIIQNERRSTRLYLVLLIVSIIISTFYYTIVPYTKIVVKESPSLNEYLTVVHHLSLQCPCSKAEIPYEKFIEIEPFYFEICQSNFIGDDWMNHLLSLYEQSQINSTSSDFRRIAVFQFQTIRSLCQLAKDLNKNNIQSFLKKKFIQSQLISPAVFQVQIHSFLTEFIDSVSKTFLRTLHFVQNTTAQSLLMTGAPVTSVQPYYQSYNSFRETNFPFTETVYTFLDGTSCTCSSSTATTCLGAATFQNQTVDGFQTGCYMLNALFQSTLQILYDQSFLDRFTNSSKHFQKLKSSFSNSTIDMLLRRMFVDHWLNGSYYERYFNICAPHLCQYTMILYQDFLNVFTFIIGFYGGLSSALRIIVPFIIMKAWPIIYKSFKQRQTRANQTEVNGNTRRSTVNGRVKTSLRSIKQKVLESNLFESIPPSQDENIIRQQRYSTRLYIILLLICLVILILFTALRIQTISVTHKNPTLTEYENLYHQYSLTLDCPCNQTTIKYNQFILSMNPQYHEICTSDFVSPKWINIKFIESKMTKFFLHDIRSQFQSHFQLLSTLCHAANQAIEDNLKLFYQTELISQQVINRESFEIQIDLIIKQFKRTIPKSFQSTLEIIQANQKLNQFIVPKTSLFVYTKTNDNKKILVIRYPYLYSDHSDCLQNDKHDCECISLSMAPCYKKTRIINESVNSIIPGMVLSWFPLQSLLMSTLECLYNDSCLFQIKTLINTSVSSTNFTTLKLSSEYYINNSYDSIETLANKLFIQSWNIKSSFELYFNRCHPLKCHYTYQSRLVLIYMVTTIIGLIGGLAIALRLLAPFIVKVASKVWNIMTQSRRNIVVSQVQSSSSRLELWSRIQFYFKFIWRTLIELNLFPSIPPSQDRKIVRRSQYATRIYLILLMIALIIILIYTSLRRDTVTTVIDSPTVSKYEELYMQYPTTLKCPCTHIAVKYNKFISQIKLDYHQICSSTFVSSEWIERPKLDGNIDAGNRDINNHFDSTMQFMMISKFCNLSQKTVDSSLSTFNQTDLVTVDAISRNDFNLQTEVLIEQFQRTIMNEFMQILRLIQITNHGNQLATVFLSNWRFIPQDAQQVWNGSGVPPDTSVLPQIKTYGIDKCSCAIQPNCSELVTYHHRASNQSLIQPLPGFRIGCFPLNALLQSTLSCLYKQSCVTMMQAVNYYSKPIPIGTLMYSSLIEPNATIEALLSQLFILKWSYNFSFDRYFNECNPRSCQYSYSTKYNRIYVTTTLIALFGGLIEGLHFIISYMALIIFKIYDHLKKKKNNIVVPYSEQTNMNAIDNENDMPKMIPMPTIVTVQTSINTIDLQHEPITRKTECAYLVCFHLLAIFVIVVASTIWFMGDGNQVNKIILSSTVSTFITTRVATESTATIAHKCHMTLKYQVETYLTGLDPKSLLINDFNGDLILDLVVTNYGDDTFSILLGNGNGTFQTQRIFSTGNRTKPWGIATGYFNNDTFLDLAVSLSGTNEVAIFYGNATDDMFIRYPNTLTSFSDSILGDIEIFDVNYDGLSDLAICSSVMPDTQNDGMISFFFNTGDDRQFEWNSDMASFSHCHILDIENIDNNENRYKMIFYIYMISANTPLLGIFSLSDYHMTTFSVQSYNMHGLASSMIRGRFNDDEFDDLALIFPQINTLLILLSNEYREFAQEVYFTATHPTSAVRINFNNDQIDDLAVLSCNRTVSVFLGTLSGFMDQNYLSFLPDERISTQCAHSLKTADLNGDGKDDLVFIDAETHSINVLLSTNCHE